ncbi:MAG: FtsX-like permease family protein [Gemmatimonadetes bacterium]|nr:FtsX-like permease family protein [Gemmatimonadota bacterium]MYD24718.1 FtsX-like permease family protein [Gemmatimonadota bacterium]
MVFHYLSVAFRNLIRQPGYTSINILGLAIGITCCMLIVLYIQHELSYDRFHEKADRIYRVVNGNFARTPPALGLALKEQFPEVEEFVRMRGTTNIWMMSYGDNTFLESDVYTVGKGFFNVFSFPLKQGNPETALDDFAYPERAIVISEPMAAKLFGDENPMDKFIRADDRYDFRVTGIMEAVPSNSHFAADYLVSENLNIENRREVYATSWSGAQQGAQHYTYILLAKGTASGELEDKIARWVDTYVPLQTLAARGVSFSPRLQPLTDIHLRSHLERDMGGNSDIGYIYVFTAVAVFIVLIACINFMNLATAQSAARSKEVAIRKTFGAQRGALLIQFMGEAMLSAGLAFIVALGLFTAILPWFNTLAGEAIQIGYLDNPGMLLWLLGIAVFAGLLSGSYPALFVSGFHPIQIFKDEMTSGMTGSMLRKSLVVVQFTLSILLIVSTAIVYQQLDYMQSRNLGFDKDQVVVIPLVAGVEQDFDTFKTRLSQSPHIQGMTRSVLMPGRMASSAMIPSFPTRMADQPEEDLIGIPALFVSTGFVETLGLELLSGRAFSSALDDDTNNAVILNRSAIERMGQAAPEEVAGRHIRYRTGPPIRIIGVVEDFHMQSLHDAAGPMQLRLLRRGGGQSAIRLQARNILDGISAIEASWASVFPHYPLAYSFLDEDFERLYLSEQRTANLLGAFSFLAIFIACLGLFGLTSFATRQRTREVGIHKVMGASVARVFYMLSKDFLKLVAIAVPVAWVLAYWAMSNWLQNFAYRVDIGPGWFLVAGLLALVIALVTVSVKAIATAMVNPVETLRSE